MKDTFKTVLAVSLIVFAISAVVCVAKISASAASVDDGTVAEITSDELMLGE